MMGTACRTAAAEPVAVYWTTDRTVDRLDIAHMGRSLRARGKTGEERAIAVWEYVRRTMFHYPMRNETHADQFDAAKLINVYGYSFCTQQGVVAAALARAAGLKSRVIGIPGHGMYEVKYDGRVHAFCTEFAFYVRTRDADRHIAGMAEMKADPTLISKAREEGRTSKPFLPCAGGPKILSEQEGTPECPYSLTCRYYDEKFFVKGVKEWRVIGVPNPSKYSAWLPLRRGESLRLDWAGSGPFVPPSDLPRSPLLAKRFWPPRHLCGEKDKANPFFDELAPYVRKIKGRNIYRYHGSGRQVWKPRLTGNAALEDLAQASNVTAAGGTLRALESGKPAVAEFEMTGPYAYVDGQISGRTHVPPGARLAISFQGADADAPFKQIHLAPAGEHKFSIDLGKRVLPTGPAGGRAFTTYRFRLRVEISGEAKLSELEIRAGVQHNMAALPQLRPGKNTLRLRVRPSKKRSAEDLARAGIRFELVWDEAGQERRLRHRLTESADSLEINVKGRAIPRMRYVLFNRK